SAMDWHRLPRRCAARNDRVLVLGFGAEVAARSAGTDCHAAARLAMTVLVLGFGAASKFVK
ncbi:MAG: hypothetical protein ACYC6H_12710, partial [Bellilinea sp.]